MTLKEIYEHLHKDGEPDFNSVNIDTMLLLDIAMSLRNIVNLSMESMEMNKAVLASLDREEDEKFN
jgi:hypothetical protein